MPDLDLADAQARLAKCQFLREWEILALCELVSAILMEESNVQPCYSPITVVGDIHGQLFDLLHLLSDNVSGMPPDTSYIFMGDFVDRGYYSLETFSLLMVLKARWPSRVTLLRGNHESRQITQAYGFYDECQTKYGNAAAWKACCAVFDLLNLAAVRRCFCIIDKSQCTKNEQTIDETILCVHGGLSPEVRALDQIRVIARAQEIPHAGAFCDLMWSDPEESLPTWSISPRGAGWLFGARVAEEFNQVNGLNLIARAHQLVMEGYKFCFADQMAGSGGVTSQVTRTMLTAKPEDDQPLEHETGSVVTVWSAPNYCYRCGNVASVMEVGKGSGGRSDLNFKIFDDVPDQEAKGPGPHTKLGPASQYFL